MELRRLLRGGLSVVLATTASLVSAASAAAALPSASTGGASEVTQSSVLLKGSINPNGEATTYWFEYGPTKAYGTQTPSQGPTGATKGNMAVSAAVQGLTAGSTYHYRLVAMNGSGTKLGGDKTFKTQPQPPTITLGAAPSQIVFGRPTVLSGQFTPAPGRPVAGVKVTLQEDPAPFNPQEFKAVATTKTDTSGRFSFTQMPASNTNYRVLSATNPKATSGAAVVNVACRVTVSLSTAHPRHARKVVFSGTVGPLKNGALIRIQKRARNGWRTLRSAVLGPSLTPGLSAFRIGVRVRTKGVYRAYVGGDATNLAGWSRSRTIRPH